MDEELANEMRAKLMTLHFIQINHEDRINHYP